MAQAFPVLAALPTELAEYICTRLMMACTEFVYCGTDGEYICTRLTHARFADIDVVPRELQEEQRAMLEGRAVLYAHTR